jgi:hypothetical protein
MILRAGLVLSPKLSRDPSLLDRQRRQRQAQTEAS